MDTTLILTPGEEDVYIDQIDEALVGVMIAEGVNISPMGQRSIDAALTETVWNDEETGRADVRLMTDTDIPAQWVSVHADDAVLLEVLVDALACALPVQDFEALLAASGRAEPGCLSRLALTHDPRLDTELPPLLARALGNADPRVREDAAMAAHLAALENTATLLGAARAQEVNDGVRAMIEHAIETIEYARDTS